MQPLLSIISENVRFYRKKTNLSQLKLAMQLEMSPSYLAEIERGRQYPSLKVVERLADFFKIEPYQILQPLELENEKEISIHKERILRNVKARINTLLDSLMDKEPQAPEEFLS